MHPLEKFIYCPICGSKHFVVDTVSSKKCEDCGFIFYMNQSTATAAFILNEKNELLVERRGVDPGKGTLDLPGGFVNLNETAEEGLKREIEEETGLKISSVEYMFNLPNIYPYGGINVHTLDLFYRCRIEGDVTLKAGDDAADCFWMPLSEIKTEEFGLDSIREAVRRFVASRQVFF
ncbi:MAG: NUDIX domain-containing protein [Prevotella sp.]|nr:NUDIX domain-containing protein [Prevotella sp.]MDD6818220.1 NUDIX domain-containing protein [Prevotellaceae bacterium]MCI6558515.1 NUDIX domain-containing protein [Prevotella sp.]MCI7044802.1 NUDIX domain-containing protein [Prevotella sp.]MDD6843554.1 NUDIX domain-containing protein [Prevotellaceae bacterium]